MFDDSTSGVSFNSNLRPIQNRDDSAVNKARPETRDRNKFQKVLSDDGKESQVDGEIEEDGTAEGSVIDMLKKGKAGGQSSLDFSLGDEEGGDKDELLSLLKGIEADREKQTQGLGAVDPSLVTVPGDTSKLSPIASVSTASQASQGPSASNRADVWQLVEKVVETITAMKGDGKIETTVTLKGPPIFQGAQVRIEEFSHAKGEFNIAFENLSPQAKLLIDLDSNRDSLKRSLEERGYMLHIMTSNTEIEKPKTTQQSSPFFQDRENQQQASDGQQQQQQNPEDQEEA